MLLLQQQFIIIIITIIDIVVKNTKTVFLLCNFRRFMRYVTMAWTTKQVIGSSTGIFVAIANNTLFGYCIDFSFMQKIISIFIKGHVPWRCLVNFLPLIYQNFILD